MDKLLPIYNKKASALTMSSREIADLINKNHSDLYRSIERLITKRVIGGYQPTPYTHPQNGQTYREYHLNKRDSLVVVAQNCPEFTAAIVDRWQELENQQKPTALLPQNYAAALRELAESVEREEALKLENKQQADHIEAMNSYFRAGMTAPQFVKGLNGVNSTQINAFLQQKNWLYKDQRGEWRVTSYARDVYMTEEANEFIPHGCDPIIKYKPTLLKKGAAKLYEWYTKGILTMKATWNGKFIQEKAVA
ncbi:Rha family transcriptional regulator [Aggregatibacter actinomycetemcomitans]|uniref:Rha family transcriptional regulator n=1 Tax=Aggregatibacter actinomycetemcomitans TaxID=714 RepID=UPI00197B4249|nr:Rha family transcriptional regulator [Aggregatibacter actinomycetemcomitans]MBN6075769.1 Rha family transcriptional regulator [Aggregatibacter actinomycetemcomitans]